MRALSPPIAPGLSGNGADIFQAVSLLDGNGLEVDIGGHQLGGALPVVEAAGMRIAPLEVAKYFAHETMIPEIEGITPFAFHKWAGTNADYPRF